MKDKAAFWIAVVIVSAGCGLLAWGALWVFYQIGKLVWG